MSALIRRHATVPTVISLIALFVALAGVGYAAKTAKKNSVTSKSIRDGQIKAADLADGAVNAAKLADGSVGGAKLADGAVNAAKLADGSVSGGEIAAGGVGAAQLADGSVGAAKLADGAVNAAKVADASLGMGELTPAATAALKDSCPAGMTKIANTLCIESSASTGQWSIAVTDCSSKNLRLPTPDEIYLAYTKNLLAGGATYWSSSVWGAVDNPIGQGVAVTGTDGAGINRNLGQNYFHFCVTTPSDG